MTAAGSTLPDAARRVAREALRDPPVDLLGPSLTWARAATTAREETP
ncbi:hypothetical protein [Streptomyces cinereospinus]|uniref:Uncharacterized protein n=1 Tax=Streptomyces cinereospinus TaxID=285561 RepID=A0ABV5N3J0_9ACTN